MEIELPEHLIIDPKDLECVICYSRYACATNDAMIMACGHTVCSRCLKNIKFCPLCRTEILKEPTKNMLLSSLLEKDSYYHKCFSHQKPLEIYSKKDEKLVCSQCLLEEHQEEYESLQKIELKVKEIREQEKAVYKKKEENQAELHKLLAQKNLNMKRKIDELYDEKIAYELCKKKKLKRLADALLLTERDRYEHLLLVQGFPLYEESLKELQTMWRKEPNGAVAAQILKTQIFPGQLVDIYDEKAKEVWGDVHRKEEGMTKLFMELSIDYEQISRYLSEEIGDTEMYIEVEKRNNIEIARNYLMNTLKDYGFEASWKEKHGYITLEKSMECGALERFYPQYFQCALEKISLSCNKISDAKFEVLCELLKNVQRLTQLTFDFERSSSRKIDLVSGLFFKLDALEKLHFRTPLTLSIQDSFKNFLEALLASQRTSSFGLRCYNSHASISCHQDERSRSAQIFKPLTKFSAKFIGTTPLIFDPILRVLSSQMLKVTSLEVLRLCFGKGVKYDKMIDSLCEILPKSNRLYDLSLGFANAKALKSNANAQKISQAISSLPRLTRVTLFLSGDSLSDDKIFNDFFPITELRLLPESKLEEFSLTIMRCGYIDIERIIKYLGRFPQLKKLVVRINRIYISFSRILKFLACVTFLTKLACLEVFCRDFEALNEEEKKELQVCKFRLLEHGVKSKIVFEELSSQHLPDFVDILSEHDEEEDADESETEEESDYSEDDSEEDGEVGDSESTA